MTISEHIRVLCARLNISQAELARRVGQSPQSFSAKMKRESFSVEELAKRTFHRHTHKKPLRSKG